MRAIGTEHQLPPIAEPRIQGRGRRRAATPVRSRRRSPRPRRPLRGSATQSGRPEKRNPPAGRASKSPSHALSPSRTRVPRRRDAANNRDGRRRQGGGAHFRNFFRRRLRSCIIGREPLQRSAELAAHEIDHRLNIYPSRHVVDEEHEHGHAGNGKKNPETQRKMRDEFAFVRGSNATQDHQSVDEGREKGAESNLVAPIACEVAQEARSHLAGRERQRRDRDREGRARDPDGGRRHNAQEGSRARGSTVVDPGALDERPRNQSPAIELDQQEPSSETESDHDGRHKPKGLAEPAADLADVRRHPHLRFERPRDRLPDGASQRKNIVLLEACSFLSIASGPGRTVRSFP